jgi:hypothetical protein
MQVTLRDRRGKAGFSKRHQMSIKTAGHTIKQPTRELLGNQITKE